MEQLSHPRQPLIQQRLSIPLHNRGQRQPLRDGLHPSLVLVLTTPLSDAPVRVSLSQWAVKEAHPDSLAVLDALVVRRIAHHRPHRSLTQLLRCCLIHLFTSSLLAQAAGADATLVNSAGTSALHWSVHSDDERIIVGLMDRIRSQAARTGVGRGGGAGRSAETSSPTSAVHWLNARNETPLHWAVDWQKATAVRVLLSLHSSVHAVDEHGDTPLHRVPIDCDQHSTCRQIVSSLIAAGANITAENHAHRTPLRHFRTDQGPSQQQQQQRRGSESAAAPLAQEQWEEEMEGRAVEFRQNLTEHFDTV